MGQGLRDATLAALCSRGPWTGSARSNGVAWVLTSEELRALYAAIQQSRIEPWDVLDVVRGDRKADRAFQLLRGAKLIEYSGTPKRWRVPATRGEEG